MVGDGQGLCKASVCRSVQVVTYSLLRLVPRHVRFHSRDEMGATQENFFRSFRIPQVAGVVDGTLIPILTPHVDGHVYICRKGYAAVNCQVVRPSGHHPGCRSEMAWKHSRVTTPSCSASPPSDGWLQPPGESGGSSETVAIRLGLTCSPQWLTRETSTRNSTTKPTVWPGALSIARLAGGSCASDASTSPAEGSSLRQPSRAL